MTPSKLLKEGCHGVNLFIVRIVKGNVLLVRALLLLAVTQVHLQREVVVSTNMLFLCVILGGQRVCVYMCVHMDCPRGFQTAALADGSCVLCYVTASS